MRQTLLTVLLIPAIACGGAATPSSPTPATTTPALPTGTLVLAGTVSETSPTQSTRISGAAIQIVDGVNAGRSVTSDANGVFQIGLLQSGTFTIRVRAAEYVDLSQVITLASDQTTTIELDPLFKMVTSSRNESLNGGRPECTGYWDDPPVPDPCGLEYVIDVHHAGVVTAEVTSSDPEVSLVVELYRSVNGHAEGPGTPLGTTDVFAHKQYVIAVRKFGLDGGPPRRTVSPFTLTVTRPN